VAPVEPAQPAAAAEFAPWMVWPTYLWGGWVRWMELSLRMWQSLLDGERRGLMRLEPADAVERPLTPAPWLPEVSATVIPLRRRTDPPGAEGTRISMRFYMPGLPWNGTGAKVIAVDALVARREASAPGEAEE
jgi:hypothetical protein